MAKIKVDVISGFLGAGKTTLLSLYAAYRIKQDERIAVIENEFGEVGIDGLILKNQGLTVHEIVNGCICCTLKGDILYTLKSLASSGSVDRVLIEPTGIFMLHEIYDILADRELEPDYEIGTVVTVVDAKNYLRQRKKYDWFFTNQIRWAHRLVLSKTGLVDKDTLMETMLVLQSIPDAPDIEAGIWDLYTAEDWERIFTGRTAETDLQGTSPSRQEADEHHQHRHSGFTGISIPCRRVFNENTLKQTVGMLSSGMFGDIPRSKGIVPHEKNGTLVFDYVDGEIDIRHMDDFTENACISFIGSGIQKHTLVMLFKEI